MSDEIVPDPIKKPWGRKPMIIGEAPGEKEVEQGIPFVGKSGRFLFSFFETRGFSREKFHITNVFLERPADNDVKRFFTKRKQYGIEFLPKYDGLLLRKDKFYHIERLFDEVQNISPDTILLVGRTAYWVFFGDHSKFSKMVKSGKVLTHILFPDTVFVVSYHPAFVLRRRKATRVFENSLKLFLAMTTEKV